MGSAPTVMQAPPEKEESPVIEPGLLTSTRKLTYSTGSQILEADELTIEKPDGSSWEQKVKFEWKPKLCMDCNKFGHNTGDCQQAIQQEEDPKQNKRKRKKKAKWEWKPKPNDTENSTTTMMYCFVTDNNSSFSSYITFVYGLHTIHDRIPLWGSLRNIHTNRPWLIIGDFNNVIHVEDRLNGAPVHQAEITDFPQSIDDIDAFGNADWFQQYNGVEAIYMLPGCSDNSPIMITTEVTRMKVKKLFRLLSTVIQLQEYKQEVHDKLNKDYFDNSLFEEERSTLGLIDKWEAVHEQVLRRKSRATWIKLGDCNSEYFHTYMRSRQARNKIQQEFIQFFQHLLGEAANELPSIDINIAINGPCLIMDQQHQLLKHVISKKIAHVVQNLPSDKTPGINGYPAEFFREFWPIIGKEVTEAILQFFETGKLLKEINCTTVTLIPKVQNPTYVKEFRHITCCSTLYKIIAKILTARLKLVVDILVGPSQSAFIKGRNILDNVIMAHELIKGYTQKIVSSICMIKVDIKKAYDSRMELLDNGITRIWDPLQTGNPDNGTYEISMKLMMGVFEHFSAVSGLKANLKKSSLYIAGVHVAFKEKMIVELHLTLGTLPFKYPGVPLSTRKLITHQCIPLVEKIVDRIRSWTSKFLSYAGRLQLIKSVLFEMQTYWAQVFLIPKKAIKTINSICRNFLWVGVHDNTSRAPVAWETLCKPRAADGLNIINYALWNKVELGWDYSVSVAASLTTASKLHHFDLVSLADEMLENLIEPWLWIKFELINVSDLFNLMLVSSSVNV
ncbi:uncharacterized protein LOC142167054 [Nicotiana tabacum]|uniref:Uncharacterized protein LOC142167054 n=1 Tax=Nicotiana tabacum TaxID=4097 RepID=A0AC58SED3_TOBAC